MRMTPIQEPDASLRTLAISARVLRWESMRELRSKNKINAPAIDTLSFVDVYAGCGGLSLGLMQAGWTGLFAIEHEQNAFQTLHHNLIKAPRHCFRWPEWLPKEPIGITDVLQDKRQELAALAGKVTMVVGGPPCQGFSSAGRRNPNDPRNGLVDAYLDFVQLLRPRIVLIENVRGITLDFTDLTDQNGKINYARLIIEELSKEYHVHTQMIDTSRFGVPQKRARFFVLAFRKGASLANLRPFELIERSRSSFLRQKGITSLPVSARMAISDLEIRRNGRITSRDSLGFEDIAYEGPLTTYQSLMNEGHHGLLPDTRLARHRPEIEARFRKIIELCHANGRLNTSLSPEVRASFGLKKSAIRVLDPECPAPTITSMPDDLIHYNEPRTLTVRENARLQSFPDWFAFQGKYTTGGDRRRREVPRFTQVANAVPPLMAEAIGRTLAEIARQNSRDLAEMCIE